MIQTPPPARSAEPSFSRHGAAGDDEAGLIEELRARRPEAFETLVQGNAPRLLAVACRILRNEQDGADAVQEAFVSAFQAIPKFDGNSSLRTWLYRIVVNACLMKLRYDVRHPVVSIEALCPRFDAQGHQLDPIVPWVEDPTALLVQAEVRDQIRVFIDELPDAYREVLLLRDVDELDTRQTAEVLGVSTAVVKTRLHRARQALRTLLEPTCRKPND